MRYEKVLRTFKDVSEAHKACAEYMMSAGLYAWVLTPRSEGRWLPWGSSSVPHLFGFHLSSGGQSETVQQRIEDWSL